MLKEETSEDANFECKNEAGFTENHPTEPDLSEERAWLDENFPQTRGDCENGLRPCPFFRCKYNLVLDVHDTGRIQVNFDPTDEESEWKPTCALDVADEGGKILEDIGDILRLTRERIRQIQVDALCHLQTRNRETLEALRKECYED